MTEVLSKSTAIVAEGSDINDVVAELRKQGSHFDWLKCWRATGEAITTTEDDTPEKTKYEDQYEALSVLICSTPATTSEDLMAQIDWLQEDLGYYITESVGENHRCVFYVLKQSVRGIAKQQT